MKRRKKYTRKVKHTETNITKVIIGQNQTKIAEGYL